jgi:hypothetical protein
MTAADDRVACPEVVLLMMRIVEFLCRA